MTKRILAVLFLLISVISYAQNGKIRGSVFDDATGESLVGVTVVVKGTTNGTITDLDGKFTLSLAPGKYDLKISYISYQTLFIEQVEVKEDEVNVLSNLRLKEETLALKEVVVTAKVVRTTETALQTIKRKSAVMMDGISAAKMKLIGDGTAVEAAKRVTGVSVEGGKYVYVRGLGDRYSKTTMNGIEIPGLDPDRNTLQMDIFPTNLINNMMISKNFTAEKPADFTGGLLDIETKDFPEERIASVSVGISYNPMMHFNSDYLTYDGGELDYLGIDDGTRDLPAGAGPNIPSLSGTGTFEEIKAFTSSFNPEMGTTQETSLLDYSASLTLGNQYDLNDSESNPKLGYIFSASYKSQYRYYDDLVYGEFQKLPDADSKELVDASYRDGRKGKRDILVGLLGGIAFKTNNTKIRLTAMHLQNGEKTAGNFDVAGGNAPGKSPYLAYSHNLEYNERSLSNIFLGGTHVFNDAGWEIDWRISPTFSSSDDPDIRRTPLSYGNSLENAPTFNSGEGGNPSRIWRNLDEISVGSRLDLTKKYKFKGTDAKLKFGASYTYKDRQYEILRFDIQQAMIQDILSDDLSDIFIEDNYFPTSTTGRHGFYYNTDVTEPNSNQYESNSMTTGVYISNEMELFPKFKTILGVRAEKFTQWHTGRDQTATLVLDNEKVLDSFDFFPTANFIYAITEKQNIRASYSRTIARPSFKELSYAQILDPLSGRTFNGSLFPISDSQGNQVWDGDLIETNIDNIDLRWEMFFEGGQTYSISAFYKRFENPIELVLIPESSGVDYQARNVGDAVVYGFEMEFVKKLDFISPALKNFSLNGNFTYVYSRVDMTKSEYDSRKRFEKTGEETKDTREMAGQSPFVINGGLTYGNYDLGLNAGLFYNVKGPTLAVVGIGYFPDVYTQSFHSLNFSISKTFGAKRNLSVDMKVSNILNDNFEQIFESYDAASQPYETYSIGTSISLGVGYKF